MARLRSRLNAALAKSMVESTKASCLRTNSLAVSDAPGGPLLCSNVRRPGCSRPSSWLPRATEKDVHGVATSTAA